MRSIHVTAPDVTIALPPDPKVDQSHKILALDGDVLLDGGDHPLDGGLTVIISGTALEITFSVLGTWTACYTVTKAYVDAQITAANAYALEQASQQIGVITFSGKINAANVSTVSYFADADRSALLPTEPQNFPIATPNSAKNIFALAVNLQTVVPSGSCVIELMRNGSAVTGMLVVYNAGDSGVLSAESTDGIDLNTGDVFDIRATVTGTGSTPLECSVTIS